MRTDLFDYDLPPEFIAQVPGPRGESRLLVLHRDSQTIEHRRFSDLPDYLRPGDLLVLNDTRVTARRLKAFRENGALAEVLLLQPTGETGWIALTKPGRALKPGRTLTLCDPEGRSIIATVSGTLPDGTRILELPDSAARDALAGWGEIPLPPYIQTSLPRTQETRYQTIYARQDGSAAAPTAGLHFTPEQLDRVQAQGVEVARLTLHVGIDTFRPVRETDIAQHTMHGETAILDAETAQQINGAKGRIFAVGTTTVRTLETAALPTTDASQPEQAPLARRVLPFRGETRLFITPGFQFRAVDALITNFHLPRSTLLMLVSAFAGRDLVLRAYHEAIQANYRFYSFGDAMLIL